MSTQNNYPDPLGMSLLKEAVDRLVKLRDELPPEEKRPGRWSLLVDQLEHAYDESTRKYELLKDRYALLKRSNAALSDELVWLRDQLDDLASVPVATDRRKP